MLKKISNPLVLVGVVNRPKDLKIILNRHWYRIPMKYTPKRRPGYLAFYQTHVFGKEGKAIRYYAPVKSCSIARRLKLLPEEKDHPRAGEYYHKFNLGKVKQPDHIIRNNSRRRISFGFTTLTKLQQSEQICQLFDIIPLEDIMRQTLKKKGIEAVQEYCLMENGRCRYRLDFAIFCRHGKIALECDNEKWHSTPARRLTDSQRDRYLASRGWVVIRLPGKQIQRDIGPGLKGIEKTIDGLGGLL